MNDRIFSIDEIMKGFELLLICGFEIVDVICHFKIIISQMFFFEQNLQSSHHYTLVNLYQTIYTNNYSSVSKIKKNNYSSIPLISNPQIQTKVVE